LFQNYPNPWKRSAPFSQTLIRYQLPQTSFVRVTIYNALGQMTRTLLPAQMQTAGEYSLSWDGHDDNGKKAGNGIYFYRLEAAKQVAWRKLIILE